MRLIDADEAVKKYSTWLNNYIDCGNDPFSDIAESVRYVMQQFDRQPTAYDVEAVARELEELFNTYLENVLIQREGRHYVNAMHIFDKAIEIVRGGRND